ncbi:hypothetical protein niasHS_009122 [Heterodera schachtii]|uniref:Ion transport domain-containing protein n=2 Tax=Heterodera TaxID=34509 RepID=A0ABD2JDX8_HETSC
MKIGSIFARIWGNDNSGDSAAGADPDDRWSNQYREREKTSMYRWVGVQQGGELLTVYERDGEEGVLRFAQEKMESMLYNEGAQSQLIKFSDYIRWRKSVNIALGITDEMTELNEADSRFSEHEAQWRMNKRGMDGETLIHLLLNRKELVCHEVARILINRYPGMARDIYLGEELFGQGCLHLAIVNDDYDTAKILLEYGASVNARANGDFFMPEGYEPGYNNRNMDYEGYAYYGEYPLAFAACFENKDIYDLLIQYGADPDKQDTFGNTILHMCVIHNRNSMYSYSAKHWHKPAHSLENFAGQTPLTLATKLGRKQIFEEMLELMKVEFWRFSDMTCSAYPLDALDTIRPDGSTNYDSALMTVLAGDTTEHLQIVNSEVITRLLDDKLDAFGRRKLIERGALLAVHLVALSVAVYQRPVDLANFELLQLQPADLVRVGAELVAILCSCWFVFIQQIDELRCHQGIRAYLWNLSTVPAKVVYVVANLCLLICVPLRFTGLIRIEDALLSFVLPGSWAYVLFFARTTKLIGPFVQMIYTMIAGDLFRFVLISTIFMVPFTETMFFLGKDISTKQYLNESDAEFCALSYSTSNYDSFFSTFLTLFRVCMNAIFYEELACANYEQMMKTLFVLFTFLMFIMMITLLIAMINNTYSELIEEAELTWRQQQGQIVMVLERAINAEKLAACQLEYSVQMNVPGREARGLMVIKQTTKTRAHQRKQALSNWKLVGRKVITMAKELGTQSALYLLHSHDRLVANDTIGGGGGTSVPRTPYSSTRPYSVFRGSTATLVNHHRLMTSIGKRRAEEEVEERAAKQRRQQQQQHGQQHKDQDQLEQTQSDGDEPNVVEHLLQTPSPRKRRPSMPNLQQPRLSVPSLDRHQHQQQHLMMFADQSKLRDVVTHATVNNMKLRRAELEETQQRHKKHILHAEVRHQRKLPALSDLPGMVVNVARKGMLTTGSGTSSIGRRPSTAGGEQPLRMAHLSVPQERQMMKLHQNALSTEPALDQMIVRGVDLLPSVMPNMPATPLRSYDDRRHSGVGGIHQKLHSVVAMEPPAAADQLIDQQPNDAIILMTTATMPSSTQQIHDDVEFEGQNKQSVDQINQNAPADLLNSTNDTTAGGRKRARRRVRPDLFRAKNSPPTNSSNSDRK